MKSFLRLAGLASALPLAGAALALGAAKLAAPPDGRDGGQAAPRREVSDQVAVMSNLVVDDDESVRGNAVAVMGNLAVRGEVSHDAVAVLGNLTVDGAVGHNAAAVLGNVTVNGVVHGDVVAPLGNVTLGPNAAVEGKVVCMLGGVRRARGAAIGGGVEEGRSLGRRNWDWNSTWGRPPFLGWGGWIGLALAAKAAALAVCVLFAAACPGALQRCGDGLRGRPGLALLCTLLLPLGLPLLFLALLLTIVGIPIALLLPLAVVLGTLFGEASLCALIGRSLSGGRWAPPFATLVGAALCIAAGFLPFFGFFFTFGIAWLGLGCAVAWLLGCSSGRKPSPSQPPPVVPAPPPPMPAPVAGLGATEAERVASGPPSSPTDAPPAAEAASAPPSAPSPSASALPRAGFWIRFAALALDAFIFIVFAHFWFLALAIYAAVMWKLKGSTLGGMVFGLKVVRVDDRALEWDTAIVRALGCFLSAAVLFLGFVWIAFDPEKQAWHDKIAGTVVMRTKAGSLV